MPTYCWWVLSNFPSTRCKNYGIMSFKHSERTHVLSNPAKKKFPVRLQQAFLNSGLNVSLPEKRFPLAILRVLKQHVFLFYSWQHISLQETHHSELIPELPAEWNSNSPYLRQSAPGCSARPRNWREDDWTPWHFVLSCPNYGTTSMKYNAKLIWSLPADSFSHLGCHPLRPYVGFRSIFTWDSSWATKKQSSSCFCGCLFVYGYADCTYWEYSSV